VAALPLARLGPWRALGVGSATWILVSPMTYSMAMPPPTDQL